MNLKTYTLSIEDFTKELNTAREAFLRVALEEGVIDQKQQNELSKYSVIVATKGLLGRMYDKLFNKNKDGRYTIVKVIEKNYE